MHSSKKSLIWTACIAVSLVFAGTALGGLVIGSGGVDFVADSGQSGAVAVNGPGGFRFSQSFEGGEVVTMGLFDSDGARLPDGAYKWEMTMNGAAGSKGETLSGAFTIAGGAVVDPSLIESLPTKDFVISDDLIVDGSACIGFDCVNGESFGFDTIRIKENNLRIRAMDTSSSASFPTRDWQITFNATTNGGAEKFSIDDIDGGRTPFTIEANARTNALYVDDGGRIGIGTATPVANLHVKTGNTPTLRLEQDGSSGFSPQTWDVAGNEANFFVRDATSGSTLPFRIRVGAPTSAIDIASDGDVGLGTSSPQAPLHVQESSSSFQYMVRLVNPNASASGIALRFCDGADVVGSGDCIDFNNTNNEFRINSDDGDPFEFGLDANGVLDLASTCIELGTLACTASAGGGFNCVVGSC